MDDASSAVPADGQRPPRAALLGDLVGNSLDLAEASY